MRTPHPGLPRPAVPGGLGIVLLIAGVALVAVGVYRYQQIQKAIDVERERFAVVLDSLEQNFDQVGLWTAQERRQLRVNRNRQHLAFAERLGTDPIQEKATLAAQAEAQGLIRLAGRHESPYYALAPATYSVPYVTPDAAVAADSIGARFQRLLHAAGLPAYRYVITSVLRSGEDQAALRRVNANASRTKSAHEYGTTFDVSYERYVFAGIPEAWKPVWNPELPGYAREQLDQEFAADAERRFSGKPADYMDQLASLMGRALLSLQGEKTLITIMERGQTVYHTTVSDRIAPADIPPERLVTRITPRPLDFGGPADQDEEQAVTR
ncbi:MAG: DUF5715 family protein [Bacteroidota bacterium]